MDGWMDKKMKDEGNVMHDSDGMEWSGIVVGWHGMAYFVLLLILWPTGSHTHAYSFLLRVVVYPPPPPPLLPTL